MSETKDLSKQIDPNNLIYYFKDKSISPINFVSFKVPLYLYRDISNGNKKLEKAEEDQEQFKSDLNERTRANPKKKSDHQIKTIENIKNIYESREKVIKLCNDYAKIRSEAKDKSKYGEGLTILSPKQMLQRLSIALAEVKAGINSENLLNEIRQIVYSLHQSQKLLKRYTITSLNQYKNGYYIYELRR